MAVTTLTYKLTAEKKLTERINSDNKWEVLPKRWIVERTFAWFNSCCGLSSNYEITKNSAESMVKIAHFNTLLKCLYELVSIRTDDDLLGQFSTLAEATSRSRSFLINQAMREFIDREAWQISAIWTIDCSNGER